MKKKILLVLVICLLLCGCGNKKKVTKAVEKSEIGSVDVSYSLSVNCNNLTKDSYVTLNKNKTAEYGLYECNENNLELVTGEGKYKLDGSKVIIEDNYSQKVIVTVKDKKTVSIKMGEIEQTLTK